MSHVFSDTDSSDDELLTVNLVTEALKRAAPVRNQVPRASRSRSTAAPSLAFRTSVRSSGQTGPILSKLPSTCRLLMRALHDDLVNFVRTSTASGDQSYTLAVSISLAVERVLAVERTPCGRASPCNRASRGTRASTSNKTSPGCRASPLRQSESLQYFAPSLQ